MIRYSHAMTCLMAYYNKKGIETISIVLQTMCDPNCHMATNINTNTSTNSNSNSTESETQPARIGNKIRN